MQRFGRTRNDSFAHPGAYHHNLVGESNTTTRQEAL